MLYILADGFFKWLRENQGVRKIFAPETLIGKYYNYSSTNIKVAVRSFHAVI